MTLFFCCKITNYFFPPPPASTAGCNLWTAPKRTRSATSAPSRQWCTRSRGLRLRSASTHCRRPASLPGRASTGPRVGRETSASSCIRPARSASESRMCSAFYKPCRHFSPLPLSLYIARHKVTSLSFSCS